MMKYSILDPTGNLTALAESLVPAGEQPAAAAAIMRRHPEVEQVGFLRPSREPGVQAELRMAGGEFCGNACLCAAALLSADAEESAITLRVSGAEEPVETRLRREAPGLYSGSVKMPPALEIAERDFAFGGLRGRLPLIRMEGISHAVVEPENAFYLLLRDRALAGEALRALCQSCGAPCMGLLFLAPEAEGFRLTPLVYVPGSGTLFWENSCASGTAACAMLLASREGRAVKARFSQPAGVLRAESGPEGTRLFGTAARIGEYRL